ncbi:hypothetical protein JCM11641_002305 [Rhodosporidiobolus odoratus]
MNPETPSRVTKEDLLRVLFRFNARLTSHIDPQHGINDKHDFDYINHDLCRVRNLAKNYGQPAVVQLLDSLLDAPWFHINLSLDQCSSALTIISSVIATVVRLAAPMRPCSVRLPNELLAFIVEQVQTDDDYRLRQQTNMNLALVSRYVSSLVKPILRREIHVSCAAQFEPLEDVFGTQFDRHLSQVTVVLNTREMGFQTETANFPGDGFRGLVDMMVEDADTRIKHLVLKVERMAGESLDWVGDFEAATGHRPFLRQLFGICDTLEIVGHDSVPHRHYDPIKRLFADCSSGKPAPSGLVVDRRTSEPSYWSLSSTGTLRLPPGHPAHPAPFTILDLPFICTTPQSLLAALPAQSILTRLGITLWVPLDSPTEPFDDTILHPLFAYLAPTLTSLTLRLYHKEPDTNTDLECMKGTVATSILQCKNLRYLEIGGSEATAGLAADWALLRLLETLILLPQWGGRGNDQDLVEATYSSICWAFNDPYVQLGRVPQPFPRLMRMRIWVPSSTSLLVGAAEELRKAVKEVRDLHGGRVQLEIDDFWQEDPRSY